MSFKGDSMRRSVAIGILIAVIVAIVVGIRIYLSTSKQQGEELATKTTVTTVAMQQSRVVVRGAGATFPLLQIERWIKEFRKSHSSIVITYQGVGSGAGQAQFFEKTVDFCGSDPPLSRDKWLEYKGKVLQVPYLLGAVVVVYNLPEAKGKTLNLSGEVLALIYRGDIVYWDDPRIARLNPGMHLPHKKIRVVYRADASGTQQIFTLYLHKAAPNVWPREWVSKTMKSPIVKSGRALGGKGNPGVAQILESTPYSIGFVEWSYAIKEKLPIAAIENARGEFVKPSIESLMKAASAAAKHLPKDPTEDFSRDLDFIVYANGSKAYPLTSWTHFVLWKSYEPSKARAIATFLKWIYSEGYEHIVPGYAPPPLEIKQLLLKAAEIIEESFSR